MTDRRMTVVTPEDAIIDLQDQLHEIWSMIAGFLFVVFLFLILR